MFMFVGLASVAGGEEDVLRVASWLVGSFDTRARSEPDRSSAPFPHQIVRMVLRPIQDPVVFGDALYLYVERGAVGASEPSRQWVYRLKKSGRRVRLEVFRIDPRLLIPLATEAQMLNHLSPEDLTRQPGCDILLERRGDVFEGSSPPRSCKSEQEGTAYVTSRILIASDRVVTLDQGYDENGMQTFGPTDGRGFEFRRITP